MAQIPFDEQTDKHLRQHLRKVIEFCQREALALGMTRWGEGKEATPSTVRTNMSHHTGLSFGCWGSNSGWRKTTSQTVPAGFPLCVQDIHWSISRLVLGQTSHGTSYGSECIEHELERGTRLSVGGGVAQPLTLHAKCKLPNNSFPCVGHGEG